MPNPAQASSTHLTIITDPRSSKPPSGRNTPQPPPPKLSNALFPQLPSTVPARVNAQVKGNVSLQSIWGNPAPPTPAWGSGASASPSAPVASGDGDNADAPNTGRGKKGKGKQKQTIMWDLRRDIHTGPRVLKFVSIIEDIKYRTTQN